MTARKRAATFFRYLRYAVEVVWNLRGHVEYECNLCGFKGRFRAFGHPPRYNAQCGNCESLERHRLLKLWLENSRESLGSPDVLHLAPEARLESELKAVARSYVSGDIEPGRADRTLDVENLALEDASFDLVVCVHVLEHVDDRRALAEFRRILRPGGMLVVMIPIEEGWEHTYENSAIASAEQRKVHFGQADHVRYYGADVRDRLRDGGFELQELTAEEPEVSRFGLRRGEKVFVCKVPYTHL